LQFNTFDEKLSVAIVMDILRILCLRVTAYKFDHNWCQVRGF